MYIIHQTALYLHILVGALALFVFWVPIIVRKGSFNHKRFGRYFVMAMYTIAASGLLMSGLDLIMPLQTHARGLVLSEAEQVAAISEVREIALFLFSLSILVMTSTRQGSLAIQHKEDRRPLRAASHTALCCSLVLVGCLLLWQAARSNSILFLVFGVLQLASGIGSLRYNFKPELDNREWWIEHLRALTGSGIGAYTAFFVFGGSRLFSNLFGDAFSESSVLLWIAPGVIGSIAIHYSSKHYRGLFQPDWALKKAQRRTALFK